MYVRRLAHHHSFQAMLAFSVCKTFLIFCRLMNIDVGSAYACNYLNKHQEYFNDCLWYNNVSQEQEKHNKKLLSPANTKFSTKLL